MNQKKKLSLTALISISLVIGIVVGLLLQNYADFTVNYIKPIGTIYLNLIKMIVVPVVLLSIIQGIVSLQPGNAGNTGFIPGQGRSHMPRSN